MSVPRRARQSLDNARDVVRLHTFILSHGSCNFSSSVDHQAPYLFNNVCVSLMLTSLDQAPNGSNGCYVGLFAKLVQIFRTADKRKKKKDTPWSTKPKLFYGSKAKKEKGTRRETYLQKQRDFQFCSVLAEMRMRVSTSFADKRC